MNNQQRIDQAKQQPLVPEASGGSKEESVYLFRFVKCTNCRRLVDIVGEENYCGNYNGRCPVCTAKMILSPPVPSEPMTCDDFIDCITSAGWEARGDAQHNNIRVLWDKIKSELFAASATEAKPVTPHSITSEQLPESGEYCEFHDAETDSWLLGCYMANGFRRVESDGYTPVLGKKREATKWRRLGSGVSELMHRIKELVFGDRWYQVRVEAIIELAHKMDEPFKSQVFGVVANGKERFWGEGKAISEIDIDQVPINFPELENRLTGRRSVLVDKCFGDGLTETETNEARRLELLVDSLFAPVYEDVIAELQFVQKSINQKRLDDGLEVSHICPASASYAIPTNKYTPAIDDRLFWSVEHLVWVAGYGDGENEDLVIFKFCPWCGVELATLYASPKTEAKESAPLLETEKDDGHVISNRSGKL